MKKGAQNKRAQSATGLRMFDCHALVTKLTTVAQKLKEKKIQ